MEARRVVTLTTPALAKKGAVFKARPLPACFSCKLYSVCMGKLRPGVRYRVVEVRSVKHKCPVLEEPMYVVVVEEEPILIAVEKRLAMEGVTLRYEPIECRESRCKFYEQCVANFLECGIKVRILKKVADLDCPLGRRLSLVLARPLP